MSKKKSQTLEYTEEFERFWKNFPARWNSARGAKLKRKKYPAMVSWSKLGRDAIEDILKKLPLIWKAEGDYPRDPVTWLNQHGWDDIQLPKPPLLSKEMAASITKAVPGEIDSNLARTRQRLKLEISERNRQTAVVKKG